MEVKTKGKSEMEGEEKGPGETPARREGSPQIELKTKYVGTLSLSLLLQSFSPLMKSLAR